MIAYTMLYATAVALPILLASIVGSSTLRKYGKPERGVWIAGLGLALMLPVALLMNPGGGTPPLGGPSFGGSVPLPATGVIGLPELIAVPVGRSGMGLDEVVMLVWLLASVVLTFRWAMAAYKLAGAGTSWRTETVDGVSAWLTNDLGPAVSGVFRPRIVIPSWLVSLPQQQRSLVLLHEEEHVRARDPVLIAISRMARILTPWNPFVWLLSSRLVRAVELDCDRRVLHRRPDVEAYGTALLTVSSRDPGRLVAGAAFAESEVPLRNRILAMTTPPRTVSVLGILTALVLGVLLLVGVFEVPIPAIRIQVDMEPPGSGAAVVEQEDALEQGTADLEPTAEVEPVPAPLFRAVEATAFEPSGVLIPTSELALGDVSLPTILNRDEVQSAMFREYPTALRDAGIGGTVGVWVHVDEAGMVQEMRVQSGSGHPELDRAAVAVAFTYRFSPAVRGDQPVAAWVTLPMRWGATLPMERPVPTASELERTPATEEAPAAPTEELRISVEFNETPIEDVLDVFTAYTGRSIVASGTVTGLVTANINDQPWDLALGTILGTHGLVATARGDGVIRVENIR